MQYEIDVGGRLRRVTVQRSNGRFVVEIDGRLWTVDARRLDSHALSLLIEGADAGASDVSRLSFSHEVTVTPEAVSGQVAVSVGGVPLSLSLNGRRRSGRRGEAAHAGGGPLRLVAPMPGKVVRVCVKPGDTVHPRQPIVVIEAMKMENELRAGRSGVVAEIHVREGQSVDEGGLLAVITKPSA